MRVVWSHRLGEEAGERGGARGARPAGTGLTVGAPRRRGASRATWHIGMPQGGKSACGGGQILMTCRCVHQQRLNEAMPMDRCFLGPPTAWSRDCEAWFVARQPSGSASPSRVREPRAGNEPAGPGGGFLTGFRQTDRRNTTVTTPESTRPDNGLANCHPQPPRSSEPVRHYGSSKQTSKLVCS